MFSSPLDIVVCIFLNIPLNKKQTVSTKGKNWDHKVHIVFIHNPMLYLLWLFDRITQLYGGIQHTTPLIPFVNTSRTTPNNIRGLNPPPYLNNRHPPLELWISMLSAFCTSTQRHQSFKGLHNQNQTCLLSFYTLFTFSHWNKSSRTADSENKHSERWWSADLALCRAGLIAQFIPSFREETLERRKYTAFCACSSIQCHNSGTYSDTTMGPQTLLPPLNSTASSTPTSFFAARKVFLTGSQNVLLNSYIHSYATYCLH